MRTMVSTRKDSSKALGNRVHGLASAHHMSTCDLGECMRWAYRGTQR